MEYIHKESVPYFTDYEQLVTGLGYTLVELQLIHQKSQWFIKAVIYGKGGIGIDDCSKVHRALLSRAEALLHTQDIHMEVSSPGLNRVIKNALEFQAFIGKNVKILELTCSDWIEGEIVNVDPNRVCLKTIQGWKDVPYTNIKKAKLNEA